MVKKRDARLAWIDAVRREGDLVHVLGKHDLSWGRQKLYHITHNVNNGGVVSEETFTNIPYIQFTPLLPAIPMIPLCSKFVYNNNYVGFGITGLAGSLSLVPLSFLSAKILNQPSKYYQRVNQFTNTNQRDFDQAVWGIRAYQGGIEEVSSQLGRKLALVDTGRSNTFIRAANDYNLRLQAHYLGADAIIHCQPGSSIGTPVKFVD